jgi:hypothetical protein
MYFVFYLKIIILCTYTIFIYYYYLYKKGIVGAGMISDRQRLTKIEKKIGKQLTLFFSVNVLLKFLFQKIVFTGLKNTDFGSIACFSFNLVICSLFSSP